MRGWAAVQQDKEAQKNGGEIDERDHEANLGGAGLHSQATDNPSRSEAVEYSVCERCCEDQRLRVGSFQQRGVPPHSVRQPTVLPSRNSEGRAVR